MNIGGVVNYTSFTDLILFPAFWCLGQFQSTDSDILSIYLITLRALWKSPIENTWRGWHMARYRSTENDTIVSTEAYEALQIK